MSVTISGLKISASTYGVYVDADPTNPTIHVSATIDGDTDITTGGAGTGVFVSGANAHANVQNNFASIHGNAIGINVAGGSAAINGNHIYDNTTGVEFTALGNGSLSGNSFDGGANPNNTTDLFVDSTAGAISLSGDTFAGGTFINDQKTGELNAIAETFKLSGVSTVLPTDNTLADLYAVEDRITDGLDSTPPSSLVRLRSGNVYVTQQSGSIQRGINLASATNAVHVQAGTFQENLSINKAIRCVCVWWRWSCLRFVQLVLTLWPDYSGVEPALDGVGPWSCRASRRCSRPWGVRDPL